MPNDLFNQIYGNAQNYAQELRTGMPDLPAPPQISQDVSQYTKILGDIAQGDRAQSSVKGMVGAAQDEASYQEKLRSASKASQKEAKPKRVPKSDGGFDFFDEAGNPISAYEYARLNDTDIVTVLKDSMNPEDVKLISDYSGMNDYWARAQSMKQSDLQEVEKALDMDEEADDNPINEWEEDDDKFKIYDHLKRNPELRKLSFGEQRDAFMRKWGAAFGVKG